MKKALSSAIISLMLAIFTLAAFEGAYSLVKWNKPHRSVIYQLSDLAGLTHKRSEIGAYKPYFSNPRELTDLAPLLKEAGVGVGGTPMDVRSTDSAIRTEDNGCPGLKPNLHMTAFVLHSSAFGPLGFPTVFYDLSKKLDPRIEEFFEKYGGPRTTLSTNAEGERITVPDVASDKLVLVAGDSVAFGALVDDDVTIASQMQARDSARRYVNLGVPGTTAGEIHCRLEAATQRYKGKIDELIYVYCENDFDTKIPYGTPKEVVDSLVQMAEREQIKKVTVVFSPLVYMVVPELTRIEGSEWSPAARREKERADLKNRVETAGFRWRDIGELARHEEDDKKSSLAIWAYYVDYAHLSPYGTRKVVDSLTGSD